ncbi:MAG: hypothetical protein ACKO43_03540 [Alphaproteobacteria bacterium]
MTFPFPEDAVPPSSAQTLYGDLVEKNPLELLAHLFQLSDALSAQSAGIHEGDLMALKSLYAVLSHHYGYQHFADYADLSVQALYDRLATFSSQDDPLQQIFSEVYQALWNLYYHDFCDDPYGTIATWDPHNIHETRAIRSSLFHIHYVELLRLACVMNVSCQETHPETEASLHQMIRLKYEEILSALYQREETAIEFSKSMKFLEITKQSQCLRAVLICLEKANRIYS